MTRARVCVWLGLGLSLLLGCSPAIVERRPPPLDTSPQSEWTYSAYLLSLGDASGALGYLEPLGRGPLDGIVFPALLLRDLAEARLVSGDLPGAAAAARQARDQLALRGRTAQFQADDRRIFERTIDALEAAGDDDLQHLNALAADEGATPSADTWYLLGWLRERHGDLSGAQAAYRAFLARDPQWLFLREAIGMRQHARAVLAR